MNYKTYAEAKITNPDGEIVTTGKNWDYEKETIGTFEVRVFDGDGDGAHIIADDAWVICNPEDYCSTLKEFLDAGLKLAVGDVVMTINCSISRVKKDSVDSWNHHGVNDNGFFILSASALNGGGKIPAKAERWTIYNNTLPLCDLTDEQAAALFNAWRCGGKVQFLSGDKEWKVKGCNSGFYHSDIYRIKPKSERELFIDKAISHAIKPETQSAKQMFGELFDSGKFKYIDNTQHFGENI